MKVQLKKFLSYYRPYKALIAADLLCAGAVSVVLLLLPMCVRHITNGVLTQENSNVIRQIIITGMVMFSLISVRAFCGAFYDYKGHSMGAMIERDMRNELFSHIQNLSFRFFDNWHIGQLMSRISNDLLDISELYHHGLEDAAISLILFIGTFIALFSTNPALAAVIFFFFTLMVIYATFFYKKMYRASLTGRSQIGEMNACLENSLSGIRITKAFGNEALEVEKFRRLNERFLKNRKIIYKSEMFFDNGLLCFIEIITALIAVIGGIYISQGKMEIADLLIFLLYTGNLMDPVKRFINIVRLYQVGFSGFSRFQEMLDIQPDVSDESEENSFVTSKRLKGDIRFHNVTFRYNDEAENVLENLTLSINTGEFVALVGTSGVGKTTLCSLIARFYNTTSGNIFLDSKEIQNYSTAELRENIGIVQQETYLFAGTIEENIRYGKKDATQEEIILAAKKANAHHFIEKLPLGYATDIGSHGAKLSGGQKQRISIARVFLKNPSILLFDEATSALDSESEEIIRNAIEDLRKNRTTIIIAHRLSTIRNAQRILVVSDKKIVEEGTHQELLQKNGIYKKLYHNFC